MNYSEKYYKKEIAEADYITQNVAKRYGDYRMLEERYENARVVNAERAKEQTLIELNEMAEQDKL